MRWYYFVDHAICTPSAVRRIMQVRTELFDNLIQVFDSAHTLSG